MHIYRVNHSGSCESRETGDIHTYQAGVPVELPDDVAAALGRDVDLVKKVEPEKKEEKPVKEEKEVEKAPKDKMVKGKETVTK